MHPMMLMLFACLPWEYRDWDCQSGFRSLWVARIDHVDVYPDEWVDGCARSDRQPFDERDYLITPAGLRPPDLAFDPDTHPFGDEPTRLTMKLDATSVGYDPKDFDRVQVTWGGLDDGPSSILLHNGTEVVGLESGAVGYAYGPDVPEALFVGCDNCRVWVPTPPARLDLDVVRARVRACVHGDMVVSGSVGNVQLELSSADGRWPQLAGIQIVGSYQVSYHGDPEAPPVFGATWLGPPDGYCANTDSSDTNNDSDGS